MDMGLAVALIARGSEGDDGRYEGYVMLSALPGARVVDTRRSVAGWLPKPRRRATSAGLRRVPRACQSRDTSPLHG